mgnify:CR=1 FL=1
MTELGINSKIEAGLDQQQPAMILLVDDDPLIVESLGFLLRKRYQVVVADSRKQANERLAEIDERHALAVMDLAVAVVALVASRVVLPTS